MGKVAIRVTPGARDDAVSGWQDGSLRIRVRPRAEGGKANEAACRLVAKVLQVPPSSVTIVRGGSSRNKLIEVADLDDDEIRRRLATS